ncbi:molybdopterin oxidoreductase Fe4S4 region [Desulfosudis oleivorans Hxd3]|nr:molybdopterin oxidoreductase Fe4S4 region [Desulfosudis oleivorans Hxd3]
MKNIIVINGHELSFKDGETILDVALRNGIDIPTLCHLKGTTPTGTCRVCVVEVHGADDLVTACTEEAAHNMVVRTESARVVASRRETIREMLASGNHNCAMSGTACKDWTGFQMAVQADDQAEALCPAWGDCRLQDLAYRYQVTGDVPAGDDVSYPMEMANPFIIRDFSRCIRCGRCVKACNEVQVNKAIDYLRDDEDRILKIVAGDDKPLKDSECVFCGECVQACPVGALVEKDARFEGRAWDTKKVRTTCSYCGVGCQMNLHVKDGKVVKVTGVDAPPNHGSLCVKGRFGFAFIGSPERLTTPMIKEDGKFREASWEEAIDLVAKRLSALKDAHGPDSIGVFTSARVTNEDNYAVHKFARGALKTNNIDHCARL